MSTSRDAPLLWRIEREAVLTDEAPLASLVSVAFVGSEYFLVARGDIPPVVPSIPSSTFRSDVCRCRLR
jgi:hypothetical protein